MNLNTIRAWWSEMKLWIIGIALVTAAIGYWWHGHESYKAGKLAGDNEVAALKAQYQTAYTDAQAAAHTMQAAEDAQELADANRRAESLQFQISLEQSKTDAAQRSADAFKAKLDDLRKHDPGAAALLDTPLPASVRAAGQG